MKIPVNIGIEEKDRRDIAQGLSRLLADTYTIYLKTQNFHWNVTGPFFQPLHMLFEKQYAELGLAVDRIAERIRALGFPAPATYSEFTKLSYVPETLGVPSSDQMIRLLLEANEVAVRTASSIVPMANKANDQTTINLLAERIDAHGKNAWMLRSSLEVEAAEALRAVS